MFSQDAGATKTYRALARGAGGRWARTYRYSHADHAAHSRERHHLGQTRAQRDGMLSSSPASRNPK